MQVFDGLDAQALVAENEQLCKQLARAEKITVGYIAANLS